MTTLDQDIFLWGHSLADFIEMFILTEQDLQSKILECCSGPSSFNIELTTKGGQVISCDPLFTLSFEEISTRVNAIFPAMLKTIEANKDRFIWSTVTSPVELAKQRKENIHLFLDDYMKGIAETRYQAGSLPKLPYSQYEFDLGLCSHYLFANCPDQSVEFHISAIKNLCSVAHEVRIFPLVDSQGEIPIIVGPVMKALYNCDYGIEIKSVPYQFQKKGNAMLRVWTQVCAVETT
jgi:hypothetical protein